MKSQWKQQVLAAGSGESMEATGTSKQTVESQWKLQVPTAGSGGPVNTDSRGPVNPGARGSTCVKNTAELHTANATLITIKNSIICHG